MKLRVLPVVVVLAASAALLLAACGGDGSESKDNSTVSGAEAGSKSSASPTEAASTSAASADRPRIELPSDLTYTFEWPRTGDADKDAVLADSEQSIKAVDLAIVNQNALDRAYLYYYEGEAAAGTETFIQAYVDAKARVTGSYRFYDAVANVNASSSASLVYCEDQSKGYDMYLSPEKVNKTAVTKNSYVLYRTQLRRNNKGVWAIEKIASQKGSAKCQP